MKADGVTNPDLSLADLMAAWPETITVFIRHKMLCVGCMVSPFHSVTDACAEYDLDLDEFYRELVRAVTPLPLPE